MLPSILVSSCNVRSSTRAIGSPHVARHSRTQTSSLPPARVPSWASRVPPRAPAAATLRRDSFGLARADLSLRVPLALRAQSIPQHVQDYARRWHQCCLQPCCFSRHARRVRVAPPGARRKLSTSASASRTSLGMGTNILEVSKGVRCSLGATLRTFYALWPATSSSSLFLTPTLSPCPAIDQKFYCVATISVARARNSGDGSG
jgi:hypothetical protein